MFETDLNTPLYSSHYIKHVLTWTYIWSVFTGIYWQHAGISELLPMYFHVRSVNKNMLLPMYFHTRFVNGKY